MKTLDEYLQIAEKATDLASEFILKNFGEFKESFHKMDLEYGIEEDKMLNTVYEDFLKKATPEVALLTEEGEKNLDSELVWTVDPIDGTSNYSYGNVFFNSQISLLKNREPVIGVIVNPILKQKFHAIKGQGAFLNNKKITVSSKSLAEAYLTAGKGRDPELFETYLILFNKLIKSSRSLRIIGSAGLELAYASCGMLDAFIQTDASIWDYAPGVLIVKEAGGVVVNFEGKDWDLEDRSLIAGNKTIVEEVLKLLYTTRK